MTSPLVTVVIPSHNHEKYLTEAINSVLAQNYPAIELIVIDDGSTDRSPQIIQALQQHGNFTYIRNQNKGLIATLKQALAIAEGEFFCQLASDDYLSSDSISRRVEKLSANTNCVAVYTDAYSVDGNIVTQRKITRDRLKRMYASDDPIPHILNGARPIFATGLFRTSALRAIEAFDIDTFRYYEDLDTPILLLTRGKLNYIDEPLFFRRTHDTNVSGTTTHIRPEKVKCHQKLLANPELAAYHPLLLKHLKRSYLELARSISSAKGKMQEERSLLSTGWKYALGDIRLLFHLVANRLRKQ
ncbi:MAG: glycosyltransferase family 2 protein [Gammaproteobacteria bacterium]|nr:glycosyltransferase family 2 protein [Gammaproteobacteria bacterium]MBQ0838874.1 glycosyltransferase family 2 protein [Gammaproteobacteria bacterium]